MKEQELNRAAEQEASWLHYYGLGEDREKDPLDDAEFYDRMRSIGYTKRVVALPFRCACMYVTGPKPVLECSIEELESVSGPRNHKANIYTALEYVIATGSLNYKTFVNSIKS